MYNYLLLLTASWLAYRGGSAIVIVVIAMLLSLPRFVGGKNTRELSFTTAIAAANALLFAALAYAIGVGMAHVLNS